MLLKLGPLVTEVAGSIGGMTIQRSPDGAVARSKPLPIRRQSAKSANARQRLATLNKLWGTFTPTEKGDWDTFAATVTWYNRFGDVVTGNGYRAFLKNNAAMHTNGIYSASIAVQLTPPTSTNGSLPADPEFYYDLATDDLYVGSTDAATDPKTYCFLFASQPYQPGSRVNYRPAPFLALLIESKTLPAKVTAQYVALHGRKPDKTVFESAFLRIQTADNVNYWPALDVQLPLIYK